MEGLLGLIVMIFIITRIFGKMNKEAKARMGTAWPGEPVQMGFLDDVQKERTEAAPAIQPEREPVLGSLNTDTWEGVDPCHEEQFEEEGEDEGVILKEETEETAALQLEWKGEEMVKAFIMQEVLTRPCQRRRA